jgi:hypothetical protein
MRRTSPPRLIKSTLGTHFDCCDARFTSETGHSRPMHSVPVPINVRCYSRLFSNSGPGVKLSMNILAGFRVLSAVGVYPPHDGVR